MEGGALCGTGVVLCGGAELCTVFLPAHEHSVETLSCFFPQTEHVHAEPPRSDIERGEFGALCGITVVFCGLLRDEGAALLKKPS
jgi:hypothetical protein